MLFIFTLCNNFTLCVMLFHNTIIITERRMRQDVQKEKASAVRQYL